MFYNKFESVVSQDFNQQAEMRSLIMVSRFIAIHVLKLSSSLFIFVPFRTPRFKSYQQQDSHELLRHLLDGMRTEEIKRAQAGILKAFGLPENVNPRKVDEETRAKVKGKNLK
jgi:hypothetical protein